MEKLFAEAWENINNDPNGYATTLDCLLAEDNNRPLFEVTDRDRVVAATVVQWLGSPVGQNFVRDVLGTYEEKLKT